MTDEEKKEFEEFLQWKAERAKKEAKSKVQIEKETIIPSDSSLIVSDNTDNNATGSIQDKQSSDNTGVILGIAAVAFNCSFCNSVWIKS